MSVHDTNQPMTGKAATRYLEGRLGYDLDTLLHFPKYFLIEPINMCNARCIMCGIDFDAKVTARMSDILFDKIINEMAKYKDHINKVMLYLDCEPLLDKTLPDKIRRMKEAGISWVNVATNASPLNEKNSRKLIEAGLNEIYIALDSLDKEIYEKIRIGLDFDVVYKNIINFIKIRDEMNPDLKIRLQMIEQELNFKEGSAFKSHFQPLLKANDQIVIQKEHNWAQKVDAMIYGDEDQINNIPCIALWGTLCIHADGIAGLCCMDSESELIIGDVNKQTLQEVWTGDAMQSYRDKHTSGRRHEIQLCDGCTLWRDNKQEEKIDLIDSQTVMEPI